MRDDVRTWPTRARDKDFEKRTNRSQNVNYYNLQLAIRKRNPKSIGTLLHTVDRANCGKRRLSFFFILPFFPFLTFSFLLSPLFVFALPCSCFSCGCGVRIMIETMMIMRMLWRMLSYSAKDAFAWRL